MAQEHVTHHAFDTSWFGVEILYAKIDRVKQKSEEFQGLSFSAGGSSVV